MADLGLVSLLEHFARLLVDPGGDLSPDRRPGGGGVLRRRVLGLPEAFLAEVLHLRDRFHLIGLDELTVLADSGFAVERPTALITFDDGYRDNFDTAVPILEELGVPATFFIPTGFLQSPRLPWWDHVAHVLKRSMEARVVLDWPNPSTSFLGQGNHQRAIMAVIGLYLDGKVGDELRFVRTWRPRRRDRR